MVSLCFPWDHNLQCLLGLLVNQDAVRPYDHPFFSLFLCLPPPAKKHPVTGLRIFNDIFLVFVAISRWPYLIVFGNHEAVKLKENLLSFFGNKGEEERRPQTCFISNWVTLYPCINPSKANHNKVILLKWKTLYAQRPFFYIHNLHILSQDIAVKFYSISGKSNKDFVTKLLVLRENYGITFIILTGYHNFISNHSKKRRISLRNVTRLKALLYR